MHSGIPFSIDCILLCYCARQGDFDTFGSRASEAARSAAAQSAAGGIIPGPVLDELVVPVANSIGMTLLQKMGWRPGKGIGVAQAVASSRLGSSKWGSVAGVSIENTPMYVLQPKVGVSGL